MSTTDLVQSSDPEREIPTRRISFEESIATLPKHFAADENLFASHLVAMLSSVFPDGEDFFVRSVRHYRKRITDPELRRQVNGFIGQEAMHGREHRVLNDRLDALGYPTKRMERFTRWGLELRSRKAPPISNLAATAALEHFTATLAELVMSEPEIRRLIGHEAMRHVFEWHALEESEHKAVAFDVYRAVGGSERLRVWTMKFTRFGFVFGMGLQTLFSILRDPASRNLRRVRRDWKQVRNSPIFDRELWRQLKDYDRPDFHPDDRDTEDLMTEWREKLFGDSGELNDKLTTRAA